MMHEVIDGPFDEADDGEEYGLRDSGGNLLSAPAAEETLIGLLLSDPSRFDDVQESVGGSAFAGNITAPLLRRVYEAMLTGIRRDLEFTFAGVIKDLGLNQSDKLYADQTIGQYLASLAANADETKDAGAIATRLMDVAERSANNRENDARLMTPFKSAYGLKLWEEQNEPGQHYDWLVEDLIPRNEGVLIMGETQTGKSFLTQHLSMCGARGVPFFGRRILKPFGTIWLAYEAARGQTARMRAYRKHHKLDVEPLPFAVLTIPPPLWPTTDATKRLVEDMRQIAAVHFGSTPLEHVVIDTYNAATPGASEIDSEVVSRIRAQFDYIRAELGVTTTIVGHVNALGKHRGNEQLTNNIDTVIDVRLKTKPGNNSREVLPDNDDEGRQIRLMRVKKQREGQAGGEDEFVLHIVKDGTTDAFGKARTSCVVAPPDFGFSDAPKVDEKRADKGGYGVKIGNRTFFMHCLMKALDARGISPPPELEIARSITRVVDYEHVKRLLGKVMPSDGVEDTDAARKKHAEKNRKTIERARKDLMKYRIIGVDVPYVWWTGKAVYDVLSTQRAAPPPNASDDISDTDDLAKGFI